MESHKPWNRGETDMMTNDEHHANDMHRPLVLIDFDGVINQFPDDKVRRRQNSTAWMKPEDPRAAVYAAGNWFVPDRK